MGNKRGRCPSHVLRSSGHVSGTSQIFSDVSTVQHMDRPVLRLEASLELLRDPKKFFYRNGNPCAFVGGGGKRCKCRLQPYNKSVQHLPSFALLYLFIYFCVWGGFGNAAARSARSLRTRHSSQPSTLKLDTLQEAQIGGSRNGREKRRPGRRRRQLELGARSESLCRYEGIRLVSSNTHLLIFFLTLCGT